jgi:hypothetical protein
MNREIKFRVWYKYKYNNGEMIYIDDWYWYEENRINSFSDFKDEGYTLLQYTGVKDKNNKEIYEGDIIKYADLNYQVSYEDCQFVAYCSYYHKYHWPRIENLSRSCLSSKVIGNIYENPDLLKSNI